MEFGLAYIQAGLHSGSSSICILKASTTLLLKPPVPSLSLYKCQSQFGRGKPSKNWKSHSIQRFQPGK